MRRLSPPVRLRDLRASAWRAAAAGVAVLAVAAACGNSDDPPADPFARQPGQVHFYGTDGNMLNGIGDLVHADHPNALVGMKGTTPLTPLSQSFRDRLRSVDPQLIDDSYAAESYDAVVISALAAEIAGSTDPEHIAAQINGVTVGGEVCDSPATCLDLIKDGRDIRYRGITLGLGGFTDVGEPSASTYGVLRFANGNRLDPSQTQYVPTGNPANAAAQTPPAPPDEDRSTEALRIGSLLPRTGDLASAGPPLFAGTRLGIKEINEAGGILGKPVEYVDGDDGTSKDVAIATAERLIEEGVQVIIGAGASSISLAVLPTTVAAGVILFSPANTSAALTTTDDQGLYFRTAPPDGLQANALTDIIMRDGKQRVAIITRGDSYGLGLQESVKANLISAGLSADNVATHAYDPDGQPDYAAIAAAVKTFNPDGVLIIAFDETAVIVDELVKAGFSSITN